MAGAVDDGVVEAALHLLVTLLRSGHKDTQGAFLDYVKQSREEEFFDDFRDRLQTSMANVKEARLLKAMKAAQKEQDKQVLFCLLSIDIYIYIYILFCVCNFNWLFLP